ncbi:DUF6702 family protein [Winogradskyella psychrotolerans]|uniref:DUF6702 family protein n=1 Tax=Winogradskyella psychrotolerans TaxID=1344585 RepID=UPI001C0743F9|nr:DUF6702 family protein [Winogradskyella psychrotolerans]MBU2929694.1 hypothetical protein [Winogradskyella psychrotolerans]
MMRSRFLLFIFVTLSTFSFAHDANKAFFTIQQKEAIVEVTAEFPWSIRNALIDASPGLENAKSQNDFDTAFFEYVQNNFQIRNNGSSLKLLSVNDASHKGHSHQTNFVFLFEGTEFDDIKNTMMFNIYKDQENFHNVLFQKEHINFITSLDLESFKMAPNSSSSMSQKKTGLLLLLFLVFVISFWIKKKQL